LSWLLWSVKASVIGLSLTCKTLTSSLDNYPDNIFFFTIEDNSLGFLKADFMTSLVYAEEFLYKTDSILFWSLALTKIPEIFSFFKPLS
jgi:hypothetical protein